MKATTLKEWLKNSFAIEPILACWASWQSLDTPHLGYKPMFKGSYKSKVIWLTEDELLLIDRCIAQVRQVNPKFFKTILMRFVSRKTYQDIATELGFKTAASGQAKVIDAVKDFKEILENELCFVSELKH